MWEVIFKNHISKKESIQFENAYKGLPNLAVKIK